MGHSAVATAGSVHGFPAALTSFIGRAGPVREVAGLLEQHRLVTVTGPGGTGKTRLAGEVARQVAGRPTDGAWLVELAPVHDPGLVAAVAAAALGIPEQPGVFAAEALARVLTRQQLLVAPDTCEHVIGAAAQLCAGLLSACDDMRVLATSREPLVVAGEAWYRLGPLALPDPDDLAAAARAEAVALSAGRARSADARFTLDEQTGPAVARLDGTAYRVIQHCAAPCQGRRNPDHTRKAPFPLQEPAPYRPPARAKPNQGEPHACHDRRPGGRHSDPAIRDPPGPRGRTPGAADAHRGHPLARPGDRHR